MAYIINKASRHNPSVGYSGPTCQRAGVYPGKVYQNKAEAEGDAALLQEMNPVGFIVIEYNDDSENKMNDAIANIAKHILNVKSFEIQNSDRLDFHEIYVGNIKKALEAAFRAGAMIGMK